MTKDVFIRASQIWDATRKDEAVETAHRPQKPHESPECNSEATHIAATKQSVKAPRQELTHVVVKRLFEELGQSLSILWGGL